MSTTYIFDKTPFTLSVYTNLDEAPINVVSLVLVDTCNPISWGEQLSCINQYFTKTFRGLVFNKYIRVTGGKELELLFGDGLFVPEIPYAFNYSILEDTYFRKVFREFKADGKFNLVKEYSKVPITETVYEVYDLIEERVLRSGRITPTSSVKEIYGFLDLKDDSNNDDDIVFHQDGTIQFLYGKIYKCSRYVYNSLFEPLNIEYISEPFLAIKNGTYSL